MHYGHGYCSTHYQRWREHGDPNTVLPPKGPPPAPPMPPCRIDGCGRLSNVRKRQLCGMHDMRRRRYGSPHWEPASFTERFWAFVDRGADDACWPWRGAILRGGYGHFYNFKAHRVAYELLVGPIPDGLTLDHACHSYDVECVGGNDCLHRRCVNPAHLEPVTQAENNRRGVERARRRAVWLTTQERAA